MEGINNKLRVIARRAYGFHSPDALISMCCGGIELAPPYPHAFEESRKTKEVSRVDTKGRNLDSSVLWREYEPWLRKREKFDSGQGEEPRGVDERVKFAIGPEAVVLRRILDFEKNNSGFGICILCLRTDLNPLKVTRAHVFNKAERQMDPLPDTEWQGDGVASFETDVVESDGEVTVKIGVGGMRRILAESVVPVCENCRELERRPDDEMHEMKRVLDTAPEQITISGFPPNEKSVIRAGTAVKLERMERIDRVLSARRRYYLNIIALTGKLARSNEKTGTKRSEVGTADLMARLKELQHRSGVMQVLRTDRRPRVYLFNSQGTELHAERILTWSPPKPDAWRIPEWQAQGRS